MQVQEFRNFGLIGVRNINAAVPKPLSVSALQNLANNQQEIQNFHDISHSDIISKAIECSITNT